MSALAGLGMACALGACGEQAIEGKDCPPAARQTLSGYCLPRWVSLKRDPVFARKGPGADYVALWVYRARGLPVQVVAETTDWRRVCDPTGGGAWVHRSMIDGRRTVMPLGTTPATLRKTPAAESAVVGLLNARAVARLDRCAVGWCKVKVGGVGGWLSSDNLWGVAPAAQCR